MRPGDIPIEVAGSSLQDAQRGLVEASAWLAASRSARIAAALGALYLVTMRPSGDDADREAILNTMLEALVRLPEDLVLAQIAAYRGVHFPKLDDIRLPVERSASYRRRLMVAAAFRRAVDRLSGHAVETVRRVTPEDRAKVVEGFSRLKREFGR